MKLPLENASQHGVSKAEIRRKFRETRNRINPDDRCRISQHIVRRLERLPAFVRARSVMFYVTHQSEVATDALIQRALSAGKIVSAPAVSQKGGARIIPLQLSCPERELSTGKYALREPDIRRCKALSADEIDLVIVPGIAFDLQGRRIGYGKGYYDAWLAQFDIAQRIGLAFDCQITDRIPCESHDIPVGCIVTESRVIRIVQRKKTKGEAHDCR